MKLELNYIPNIQAYKLIENGFIYSMSYQRDSKYLGYVSYNGLQGVSIFKLFDNGFDECYEWLDNMYNGC